MRYGGFTVPSSAVTGVGSVVDLLEELKSLRVPAQQFSHRVVAPVRGPSCTMQKSSGHQLLAETAYTRFTEILVVALLESLAVLHEETNDSSEAFV